MKTLLSRLLTLTLATASLMLASCVQPYGTGTLNGLPYTGTGTMPLFATHSSAATPTAYVYATRHARPWYAHYGYGRPYYGSTWYAWPYTSQWRHPGYTRYQSYGRLTQDFNVVPIGHYGGWSYINRPSHQPVMVPYRS